MRKQLCVFREISAKNTTRRGFKILNVTAYIPYVQACTQMNTHLLKVTEYE